MSLESSALLGIYIEALERVCRSPVSIRVPSSHANVNLLDVYVDRRLSPAAARRRGFAQIAEARLSRSFAGPPDEWRDVGDLHLYEYGLLWEELLDRSRGWLVTGRPGAGKTTLLRRIALQCIEARRNILRSGPAIPEEALPGDHRLALAIPLLLDVRRLPRLGRRRSGDDGGAEIAGYLNEYLKDLLPDSDAGLRSELSRILVRRLKEGRALLLIDGLDVLGTRAESDATEILSEALQAWPGLQMIVTARSAGFGTTASALDLPRAELEPLDDSQIADLCERWKKYGGIDPGLFSPAEVSPGLRRLLGVPLYCTLAILFANDRGPLPETRAGLLGLLLSRKMFVWLAARRPSAGLKGMNHDDLLDLAATLAYRVLNQRRREIPVERFRQAILRSVEAGIGTPEIAAGLGDAFYASIVGNETIFRQAVNEKGSIVVRIGDSLLIEYLAARRVTSDTRLLRRFPGSEKIQSPRWREVILLVAQLESGRGATRGAQYLRALDSGEGGWKKFFPDEANGDTMQYALRLTLHCLVGCRAPAAVLRKYSDELVRQFEERPYLSGFLADLTIEIGHRIPNRTEHRQRLLERLKGLAPEQALLKRSLLRAVVALCREEADCEELCRYVRSRFREIGVCRDFVEFAVWRRPAAFAELIQEIAQTTEVNRMERGFAAVMLGRYRETCFAREHGEILMRLFKSDAPEIVRKCAVKGLVLMGDERPGPILQGWLEAAPSSADFGDESKASVFDELRATVRMLAELRDSDSVPGLLALYRAGLDFLLSLPDSSKRADAVDPAQYVEDLCANILFSLSAIPPATIEQQAQIAATVSSGLRLERFIGIRTYAVSAAGVLRMRNEGDYLLGELERELKEARFNARRRGYTRELCRTIGETGQPGKRSFQALGEAVRKWGNADDYYVCLNALEALHRLGHPGLPGYAGKLIDLSQDPEFQDPEGRLAPTLARLLGQISYNGVNDEADAGDVQDRRGADTHRDSPPEDEPAFADRSRRDAALGWLRSKLWSDDSELAETAAVSFQSIELKAYESFRPFEARQTPADF